MSSEENLTPGCNLMTMIPLDSFTLTLHLTSISLVLYAHVFACAIRMHVILLDIRITFCTVLVVWCIQNMYYSERSEVPIALVLWSSLCGFQFNHNSCSWLQEGSKSILHYKLQEWISRHRRSKQFQVVGAETSGFYTGIRLRACVSTPNLGGLGACCPRKIFKFKTPETVTGGSWDHIHNLVC